MQEQNGIRNNTNVNNGTLDEIDLVELFGLLLSRAPLIIIAGLLCGIIAFGYTKLFITPMFQSETGIYVMSKQDESKMSYSDTQLSSQLTKDYEKLITSRYVIESVIKMCDIDMEYEKFIKRVSVENIKDTRIIYIKVKDASPERAQYIANTVREVASDHIKNVTDIEAVNVVDEANLPKNKVEPSTSKNTLLGCFIGAFISAAIIIVLHLMDDTIKDSEDVEKYLGWSTLAVIPVFEDEEAKKSTKKAVVKKNTGSES